MNAALGDLPSEDVDSQDSKAALGLNVHDGQHRLVEDGVAYVLARFRVRCNLFDEICYCQHERMKIGCYFCY